MNRLCCAECGEKRMRTPTGAVCPNGHGRIHPYLSKREAERQWKKGLPKACYESAGRYVIAGMAGGAVWEMSPVTRRSEFVRWVVPLDATYPDGVVAVVKLGGRGFGVRKFVRGDGIGAQQCANLGADDRCARAALSAREGAQAIEGGGDKGSDVGGGGGVD